MKKSLLKSSAIACALLAGMAAQAQLVGYYTFSNGTLNDSSGNGNNGFVTPPDSNPPTGLPSISLTGGYEGGAYASFDGTQSFSVPINVDPTAMPAVTFGGWFNFNSATQPIQGLISADTGDYERTLDVDNRGVTAVTGVSAFTGTTAPNVLNSGLLPLNQWVFAAVSYDASGNVILDVGGNFFTSTGAAFDTTATPTLTIGENPNFNDPFNGLMSDVFVYNGALTENQLNAIDQNGVCVPDNATMVTDAFMLLPLFGGALRLLRRHRRV